MRTANFFKINFKFKVYDYYWQVRSALGLWKAAQWRCFIDTNDIQIQELVPSDNILMEKSIYFEELMTACRLAYFSVFPVIELQNINQKRFCNLFIP